MRLMISAIGRFKNGPEAKHFQHYSNRISPRIDLRECENKRAGSGAEVRAREADLLLATLPKTPTIIVSLDERGKAFSSEAFAARLAQFRDDGNPTLAFLSGGAFGHGDAVTQAARLQLSLGPMTYPHLLVRVILAEQLYRAQQILAGHPYHHGG
ncbi:MAG: 23S rRNA (pseudouridine(1915)-N(3))-methyltransferase RlmH [Pseudomonadota bacterium]